jgi:hypothetical protein
MLTKLRETARLCDTARMCFELRRNEAVARPDFERPLLKECDAPLAQYDDLRTCSELSSKFSLK